MDMKKKEAKQVWIQINTDRPKVTLEACLRLDTLNEAFNDWVNLILKVFSKRYVKVREYMWRFAENGTTD